MRRLPRWLLVALLLTHFIVLSRQVAARRAGGTITERLVLGVVGPVAAGVAEGGSLVAALGERWRRYRTLQAENEELRERLQDMERELLKREGVVAEFQRLAAALRYARDARWPLRVADVVYVDHTSFLRSMILHVGEGGAAPNQPVAAPEGLVGRVVAVAGAYAKVQLITDRASAVGAMIERTHRQGVARGVGPNELTLAYVPQQADVRVGDRVTSAGIDGIYPRGLPIGVVKRVAPGPQLFHRIEVVPTVDFGLLDHVYLLPLTDLPAARELEPSDDGA